MKNILFIFVAISSFYITSVESVIHKTDSIKDIIPEIKNDTCVLFNIAEVLMDTETSLGSQAWRKYVRARVDSQTHDALTFFVFQKIPPKVPEHRTPALIANLQKEGIAVFAFTSRGRHEWYSTEMAAIDWITEDLLRKIHIDFSLTKLPPALSTLSILFPDYYHKGIVYATNTIGKGTLLKQIIEKTGYRPAKIVLVDDKIDSLESVEEIMKAYGIEFVGFAYNRTSKDHQDFDPMIAHIQLDWLINRGEILSDEQAALIKKEQFLDVDPENYFREMVKKL